MTNYEKILEETYNHYKKEEAGNLANYIPELGKIDSKLFALSITTVKGETFSYGDTDSLFTLQSTSKPFTYGLALMDHGSNYVHQKVGVEPSGEAFNSIIELEKSTHRPFNPMINSGAIAIANMIQSTKIDSKIVSRTDKILNLFSALANKSLGIDENIFLSEKKTAHRNRAIAHLLRHFEVISENDNIEESLDLYFKQCSILSTVNDLSQMAATLANGGIQVNSKIEIFNKKFATDILSLMFTCGMYDTAGDWAYNVGVPAKSGVSGAMFAVIPNTLGIAAYSPLIDEHGHSIRAKAAIKEIVTKCHFSIFNLN